MTKSFAENQEAEIICVTLETSSTTNNPLPPADVGICIEQNAKNTRENQFDKFLVEAIDEAITSLGEPVKNTIYQHLEDDFNISKNNIPERIEEFSEIMHKIFGLGASRLEVKFMKNLDSRMQINTQWPEHNCLSKWIDMEMPFEKYLNDLRENYIARGTKNL